MGRSSFIVFLTQVAVVREDSLTVRRTFAPFSLIGEAGVGKTSICEGIAQILVSPTCPPRLKGTRLVSLELANLVAGTKVSSLFVHRRCVGVFRVE